MADKVKPYRTYILSAVIAVGFWLVFALLVYTNLALPALLVVMLGMVFVVSIVAIHILIFQRP